MLQYSLIVRFPFKILHFKCNNCVSIRIIVNLSTASDVVGSTQFTIHPLAIIITTELLALANMVALRYIVAFILSPLCFVLKYLFGVKENPMWVPSYPWDLTCYIW